MKPQDAANSSGCRRQEGGGKVRMDADYFPLVDVTLHFGSTPAAVLSIRRGDTCEDSGRKLCNGSSTHHSVEPTTDWLGEFRRLANQTKIDTFELAHAACQARKSLPRGEWSKLWRCRNVPFSKRTGEALVRIGERFGIPNAQTSAHLPTQWTIVHQLARLPLEVIEHLIDQKAIHCGLSYEEAKELVAGILGRRSARVVCPRLAPRFRTLRAFLKAAAPRMNEAERNWLVAELREMASALTERPSANSNVQRRHFPVTGPVVTSQTLAL